MWEGLVNKTEDHDFINSIKQYDFIILYDFITLVETWVSGKISVHIEGYYCFNKSRKKAKKAKRYSGGISVLVKKSLRKGVKFFPLKVTDLFGGNLTNTFLIWTKIFLSVPFTFHQQILNILGRAQLIHMMS